MFRAVSTSHLTKSTCLNSSLLSSTATALQSCSPSAENVYQSSQESGIDIIWPSKPTFKFLALAERCI